MAQSDFTPLSVQYEVADESMFDVGTEIQHTSISKQSNDPTQAKTASFEVFTQVNDVNDVFFTFLLAYTSSSDHTKLDESSESASQNIFEPVRFLRNVAPPKRFHRTFWRSAAKRILALSSMQMLS
jgi:hypothetical protein